MVFSQDKFPLITTVIAVLNKSKTLERCLKSILGQRYPSFEIIVMDGGSTDGTVDILKTYTKKIAHWESEKDNGIYHAWNKALGYSRGDWICFLGADDYLWNNRVFEELLPYFIRAGKSDIKIVYGQAARVDGKNRLIKLMGKPWENIRWLVPHGMPLPHTGLMHHRSLFQIHGVFDETFQIAGDYELLLRELKTGRALFAEGIITVGWESGGISESSFLYSHKEIARARKKHGFHAFSWVWLAVHAKGVLRYYFHRLIRP